VSTYSDAWASMDPAIRTFYRNWADINTAQSWHVDWDPTSQIWTPFYTVGQSFPGYLGNHVASRNWGVQLTQNGSFDPNTVVLNIPTLSWSGLSQPAFDAFDFEAYGEANSVVEQYAVNYPRPKYKVRKSYWTGAPRTRRNLWP